MNIVRAARRILDLRKISPVPESEWDDARRGFADLLSRSSDAEQLQTALDMDADQLLLPVDLKTAMYERLLQLNERGPATLREYAWHLRLYGPDWDDTAEVLIAEARQSDPDAMQ